MRRGTA